MDRRSLIKRAGLAGVAATIAAPAVHAQATVRWRLAHSFPDRSTRSTARPRPSQSSYPTCRAGNLSFPFFRPGELVPALATLDAVQNGTVECTHTASNFFAGKDETFAFNGIPFSLNSRQMSAWMFEGNGLRLMREFYRGYGVINFPMGNTGAQMGGWFRKEINSLSDLKGLKMRVSGLVVGDGVPASRHRAPDHRRAAISTRRWNEARSTRSNSAARSMIRSSDSTRSPPIIIIPGWHDGSPQLDLFVGLKAYEALPSEYKSMIEAAASHAHVLMQAKYDARNPPALKQLVSPGAKLHRFPQEVVAAGYKEAMALYDEISAKNPKWKKVYDDYAPFRADQNLWFSVAESSLDIFTQSQRR